MKLILFSFIFLVAKTFSGQSIWEPVKVEVFFKSKYIHSQGKEINSVKRITYDDAPGSNIIFVTKTKDFVYPTDSIWGYKTYYSYRNTTDTNLYRRDPKYRGLPWTVGISVANIDCIIIYETYGRQITRYFSKDLDSPIYRLKLSKIKKVYSDNPSFVNAVSKISWFWKLGGLGAKNKKTNNFKIIEIYKETIVQDSTKTK